MYLSSRQTYVLDLMGDTCISTERAGQSVQVS